MNELIIDHPIVIIETLLKMGKGDKGRLLYLKKALIDGKTIYESDKKYLKKMRKELPENKNSLNDSKLSSEIQKKDLSKKILSKQKESNINRISITDFNKNHNNDNFQDIESIQTIIEDIRKTDSNIKDNLELLLINRDIPSNENRDVSFVDNTKKSKDRFLQQFEIFGLKKHDLMAYAAAGLFSLWFASFVNLINLGPMKGLTLGLSAGSAVAAGLTYKRLKKRSTI
jgi:hypothetical protein